MISLLSKKVFSRYFESFNAIRKRGGQDYRSKKLSDGNPQGLLFCGEVDATTVHTMGISLLQIYHCYKKYFFPFLCNLFHSETQEILLDKTSINGTS